MPPLPRWAASWAAGLAGAALLAVAAAGEEPDSGALEAAYGRAVFDAAVFGAGDENGHLFPIEGFPASVVTWTRRAPTEEEIRTYGIYGRTAFRLGETALAEEVWVTAEPQVRDLCRAFDRRGLTLRLEQLLGLPPIPPEHAPEVFVSLEVRRREDLFRPCTDPDPGTAGPCTADFPAGAAPEHVAWMGRQALGAWRVPGGFPWTRLGYTYDWKPGASFFGPSEFVVRAGARVEVRAITPTEEYCAPRER